MWTRSLQGFGRPVLSLARYGRPVLLARDAKLIDGWGRIRVDLKAGYTVMLQHLPDVVSVDMTKASML